MQTGLHFEPDQQQGTLVRCGITPSTGHLAVSALLLQGGAVMGAVSLALLFEGGFCLSLVPLSLLGVLLTFGARPRGSWLFSEPLPKIIPGVINVQLDSEDAHQLDALEQWLRALSQQPFGSKEDVPAALRRQRAEHTPS